LPKGLNDHLLADLFPDGGALEQLDRLLDLAYDPDKGGKPNVPELGTAIRLEREFGLTVTRAPGGVGEDFLDALGRSWDAIGSGYTDLAFGKDGQGAGFLRALDNKLQNNAAHRVVVDLLGLSSTNRAVIEDYIRSLPPALQGRIFILR
jgi:hypothetical protein